MKKSLCVYCGSRTSNHPSFQNLARELGEYLADSKIRLVYGGAHVGIMGIMADACLSKGGEVLGIIPESMIEWEVAHTKITELKIVSSMHARKALMEAESDAFLAIPGGMGTLDELFEILTWQQIRLHNKPISLINIDGFYEHLIKHLELCRRYDFIAQPDIERLHVFDSLTHWQNNFSY